MSDQDLVFRVVVLLLFIGVRFVRWHARQLHRLRTTNDASAMKKHPLDTILAGCFHGGVDPEEM